MPLDADNDPNEDLTSDVNNPVGAALVIGGGIAGMQASLDLANTGYKVYMVEKNSAMGLPFTTKLPLPDFMRTRATALLRRPRPQV